MEIFGHESEKKSGRFFLDHSAPGPDLVFKIPPKNIRLLQGGPQQVIWSYNSINSTYRGEITPVTYL